MLRCLSRVLRYEVKDLKSKTIIDKARAAKVKLGVDTRDISDADLAMETGLVPPDVVDRHELLKQKEQLLAVLEEQKMRRIARREAFLEWQAGQREKGAAHRLVRQAKTAEKFKRQHYHSRKGRILSVGHVDERGHNTNSNEPWEHADPAMLRPTERMSSTEYLVSRGGEGATSVFLTLKRG